MLYWNFRGEVKKLPVSCNQLVLLPSRGGTVNIRTCLQQTWIIIFPLPRFTGIDIYNF